MLVYISRHAQPMSSDEFDGDSEHRPLSELGWRQARKLGNRLASEFSGTVYSSPHVRCLETAELVCEQVGTVFHPEPAITERGADWTDACSGISDERKRYDRWADDADPLSENWWPGPEEPADVETRVGAFLDDLLADPDGDVLLVGHGATTGAAVRHLCGRDVDSEFVGSAGFGLHYNATLTAIEPGDPPTVLAENDTSHLDAGEVTSNSTVVE